MAGCRKALLQKEKEFTHLRDRINQERLALPWVKVDKNYVFERLKAKKSIGLVRRTQPVDR